MERPSVKWGRAAKLAAGAALVFAIREQDRGDHTHHVAVSLSFSRRLFSSVTGLPGRFIHAFLLSLTNDALLRTPPMLSSHGVSHAQTFQLLSEELGVSCSQNILEASCEFLCQGTSPCVH